MEQRCSSGLVIERWNYRMQQVQYLRSTEMEWWRSEKGTYIPVTVITADEPAAPTDFNISIL